MSRKLKKKVPKLRFSEFQGDWIFVKLHDIALIQTGLAKGENKELKNPVRMPYLRVANVQEGYLDLSIVKEITVEKEKAEKYLLKYNDVLLTEGGDFDKLGRGTIWKNQIPNCLHQNHIFVVRPHIGKLIPEHLESVTKSFYGKKYFQLASKQTTNLATINSTQLKDFPIALPSIAEQEKIASFLGSIDKRLTQLRRKHELLQTYKRGVMQKIFSQQIRFKQGNGTFFPNWKQKKLGGFLEEHNERVSAITELPIYSSSREGLKPQKEYFANRELANEGEYGVVPKGFFVYRHMSDDFTFKFNINNTGKKIAVSREYPVFTTKKDKLNSNFLLYKLNHSNEFKRFATAQKRGGTRTRLYYEVLSTWKASIPSLTEQEKIVNFLTAIDRKIEAVSQLIDRTEQFKKGLLQKMFV